MSIIGDLDTQTYFGEPPNSRRSGGWPCAYMLLYESDEVLSEYFDKQIDERHSNPPQQHIPTQVPDKPQRT